LSWHIEHAYCMCHASYTHTVVHKIAGLHEIAGQGVKGMIWLFCVYLTEESVNRKCLNRDSTWSKIVNHFL
jgi:hypothetical protein